MSNNTRPRGRYWRSTSGLLVLLSVALAACGGDETLSSETSSGSDQSADSTESTEIGGATEPESTGSTSQTDPADTADSGATASTTANDTATTTTTTTAAERSTVAGNNGLGQAINKSDVEGTPDSAIEAGDVLFFGPTEIEGLTVVAGVDLSDSGSSRYASFVLDAAQVAEFNGVVAPIDAQGRFPTTSDPGEYLVCLANSFAGDQPGPPYSVNGCDTVAFSSGASITVTFGEGGVRAKSG